MKKENAWTGSSSRGEDTCNASFGPTSLLQRGQTVPGALPSDACGRPSPSRDSRPVSLDIRTRDMPRLVHEYSFADASLCIRRGMTASENMIPSPEHSGARQPLLDFLGGRGPSEPPAHSSCADRRRRRPPSRSDPRAASASPRWHAREPSGSRLLHQLRRRPRSRRGARVAEAAATARSASREPWVTSCFGARAAANPLAIFPVPMIAIFTGLLVARSVARGYMTSFIGREMCRRPRWPCS
jgi:hypothetical protein